MALNSMSLPIWLCNSYINYTDMNPSSAAFEGQTAIVNGRPSTLTDVLVTSNLMKGK